MGGIVRGDGGNIAMSVVGISRSAAQAGEAIGNRDSRAAKEKSMVRTSVRVNVPRNADDLLALIGRIADKNKADGKNSPLAALPMARLDELVGVVA